MKKDSHNPKTLIKSGNMPKVLTSLLTNAIIGYRFAQNGKNVSEKPHDKRFFEVHFCLQLQPTRPVGDETMPLLILSLIFPVATHTPRRGRNSSILPKLNEFKNRCNPHAP